MSVEDEENDAPWETPAAAAARVAQARALREGVATGGLRFEAYLPSDLALWVLDMVERGTFTSPDEAVFVFMGQARELDPHHDLRRELFRRGIEAAHEGPFIEAEEVWDRLEEEMRNRTEPATWRWIGPDGEMADDKEEPGRA